MTFVMIFRRAHSTFTNLKAIIYSNQNYLGACHVKRLLRSPHPLVAHKLSRLRDKNTEPKKFRELVREIAALLAYEATEDLATMPRELETPLAKMTGQELKEKIASSQYYAQGWAWSKASGIDAQRGKFGISDSIVTSTHCDPWNTTINSLLNQLFQFV